MKRLNKKGFTLVELLAVIVVLALLMVVAASSIGNSLANAKKNTLKTEAQKIITSTYQDAQSAYMLDSSNIRNNLKVTSGTTSGLTSATAATAKCYAHNATGATVPTSTNCVSTYGGIWGKTTMSVLTGRDGDYNYSVLIDNSGNVKAFVVNYKTELSIKSVLSVTGAPKVPNNITVAETTAAL